MQPSDVLYGLGAAVLGGLCGLIWVAAQKLKKL